MGKSCHVFLPIGAKVTQKLKKKKMQSIFISYNQHFLTKILQHFLGEDITTPNVTTENSLELKSHFQSKK